LNFAVERTEDLFIMNMIIEDISKALQNLRQR
jgi:hypothetical protein